MVGNLLTTFILKNNPEIIWFSHLKKIRQFLFLWGGRYSWLVFYYEIHYKILPRHGCISINWQFTSAIENKFAGKRKQKQSPLMPNKIKYRKKYKRGKFPTPLRNISIVVCISRPHQRTIDILPSGVGDFRILYNPVVRSCISLNSK